MNNEELTMLEGESPIEDAPASPPNLHKVHGNDDIIDPFTLAMQEEYLDPNSILHSQNQSHRPQMPSNLSGYDTAPQTPSRELVEESPHHQHTTSFISSSSSSIIHSGQRITNESSPEKELEDYREKLQLGRETYLPVDPNHGNIRKRTNSEDFYKNIKANASINSDGLKFYDSDADTENGSIVFNGASFRHMSRESKSRFPSMSSIGTMGSDSDVYHVLPYPNTYTPHATPAPSRAGSIATSEAESFPTPNTSNLTRGQQTELGDEYVAGNSNKYKKTSTTDVLPYQARKQFNAGSDQGNYNGNEFHSNILDNKHQSYEQLRRSKELSTITGRVPQQSGTSPTTLGLPPSGVERSRSIGKELRNVIDNESHGYHPTRRKKNTKRGNQQQQQQQYPRNEEDQSLSRNPTPPSSHFRMDSCGSVSSLGSTMDGAASMMQLQSRRLTDKLVGDLQEYHDNNINGVERLSSSREPSPSESRGYFSNFLDNLSVTSGGSFRSIEDERADYRKKSQKIIQKKEKMKQKQQKSRKGWFPDPQGGGFERTTIRSLSPAARSQRTHRPKLPSIDNDTWDEEEETGRKDSRSRRTAIKKKNSSQNRPPIRNKQGQSGYGATNSRGHRHKDHDRRGIKRVQRKKSLNTTRRISNSSKRNKRYDSFSESSESSSEDDSCISSDFTSNQFGIEDEEDSSVYVGDSDSMSEDSDGYISFGEEDNENTRLIESPSGISTDEQRHSSRRKQQSSRRYASTDDWSKREKRMRDNRRTSKSRRKPQLDHKYRDSSRSKRGRHHDYPSSQTDPYYNKDDAFPQGSNEYSRDLYYEERLRMERKIRKQMMKELEERQCCNRFGRWIISGARKAKDSVSTFLGQAETFIVNLPLTIGAVALGIVTLGVVWFKFTEEMLDSCKPVHFHSSQCNFPEFPGCFYCDTSDQIYRIALGFHNGCSIVAGFIVLLFFLKICLARQTVVDEMNSPTTSSPAGLMCMTIVCVFAGHGPFGQFMVTLAAGIHFIVAVWFIYMAGAYNILPDPSWYPNTVGIGISAVKTWLYYPMPGHFLMATSLSLATFFYPISLVRVACNQKVSAPVSWIQMSAPAVSLYAWTIMAQPSFEEEHPDINDYQRVNRILYLPFMHFLFATALIGALSSVQSLYTRWHHFKGRPFSPAHAAFCFPTLAHANSVQAYRGAIGSFSTIPPGSPIKLLIDAYWLFVLISGTIATFIISAKFFYMLPTWTLRLNLEDEEPPAPHETIMANVITAGETWRQNFVSPAVLQANETGALVQVRRDGVTKYVRTRKVTALGFEPIMKEVELRRETEALLDYVEKNPPRTRKRTLSVPGITTNIENFGSNNRGVYTGTRGNTATPGNERRLRAQTSDGYYNFIARTPL